MDLSFQQIQANGRWITLSILLVLLAWESFAPFFAFFRSRLRDRARHALRNFILTILNGLMVSLAFVGLWLWAAEYGAQHDLGILRWLKLPPWAHAAGAVLLFDFWTYWWHRMNHRIPFFWRFHRVHHSDLHMDVTTASRFHFGEIMLSSLLRIPLIILFGAELWHLALYEVLMFPLVQFHHANIGLPSWLDRCLRVIIVTPDMHKVHHSRLQPETDSNYTSMLSLWDRVFRSFRLRPDPSTIELGLDEFADDKTQSVAGMLKTPLDNRHPDSTPDT